MMQPAFPALPITVAQLVQVRLGSAFGLAVASSASGRRALLLLVEYLLPPLRSVALL